ncbi:SusD/RagB family nutrient-binding outer membrane lipoprotein [Formosa sp. L2A11]|uniref:SusD/RagB family nutrient-binding outer membrane lipoprotein n=1 Tax=Formosa sp. L2A11 TaxID=2686363 RepID=UPI00131E0F86|nr:SusD/RagB family nutrient-binding outer membrane lipoprotein [Formosa sp. L2A11]
MKNILKSWSLAALTGMMVFTTACDSDFEETNIDPNNPTDISADLQLGYIERTLINQVHNYAVAGECASTWPQHLSKPVYNDADRYYPRLGSINTFWNTMYSAVIADADEMNSLAVEENNKTIQGIALTLQAISYQYLTDAFGNIPMSDAINGTEGTFNPAYDTQEQVYTQIFTLLDQAITLLESGTGTIDASQDLIYGGDASKWIKFATTIKFRAMMRISDTSLFSASELQALVNTGDLITSNSDNAFIAFTTIATPNTNPFYDIINNSRQDEWSVGKELVDFMLASGDPRITVYANPNDNGEYVGKPAGYINPGTSGYGAGAISEIGDAYMAADAPLFLVSASQINLLLAEAASKSYISGSAEDYFTTGINASLVQNGLSSGSFSPSYNGYTSIAEQLWVSTFMQGYETWSEWRRSDIPSDLPLAIDPQPGVNSIPTRFTYTNDEVSLNSSNVDTAVAQQGEDAMTTKIWWDIN